MSPKKKPPNQSNPVIFKAHMSIGEAGAEDDRQFLEDCFIETEDYKILLDIDSPKSIILGRTGAGKSALLEQIAKSKYKTIKIEPEDLSLNYISNSTILKFFHELGVKLDLFYQLLWRHVLVVSLLKEKYEITNERASKSFFKNMYSIFDRDQTKKIAVDYIKEWGSSFWLETESRIKEVTTSLEDSLKAGTDIEALGIKTNLSAIHKLNEETKAEIIHKAQAIVNKIQIQSLSKVFELLNEDIFYDQKIPYFILIDKLDENWVDDSIRNRLIRALIETVKNFGKIRNVKILVAMRNDLLERVLNNTRDSGFQSEKYESLFLRINWSEAQLKNLLQTRLNHLVRRQYSSKSITISELVPEKVMEQSFLEYMLDRTLLRPRDVIAFMNCYLSKIAGKSKINLSFLYEGEAEYSKKRLKALFEEWITDYPNIESYTKLLITDGKTHYKLSSLPTNNIEDFAGILFDYNKSDPMQSIAEEYTMEKKYDNQWFLSKWVTIMYRIGIIGVKSNPENSQLWKYLTEADLDENSINDDSTIYIHPMFWRALGIHNRNSKNFLKSL